MAQVHQILGRLDRQRRDLRMSCKALAARSGLTLRTVQRVLSGRCGDVRFGSVLAIARALGADLHLATRSTDKVRYAQAKMKARKLAGVAQGSAALEGMAVRGATLRSVARRIEEKLLAGPPIRLWS